LTKLTINFWDDEIDYREFALETQPYFHQYLDVDWKELIKVNDLEKAFDFSWSLRSILWPELVKKNLMEIRFTHNGLVGMGYGPLIYFGDTSKIKNLPTNSLKDLENGLILESPYFPDSDKFMSDYMDGSGFLGIQSLQVQFLSYEEIEAGDEIDPFYENTFSADFKITDEKMNGAAWTDIGNQEQARILDNLIYFSLGQLEEYGEFVHDVSDLFATILVHESTHPNVAKTLLAKLEILRLKDLSTIYHN